MIFEGYRKFKNYLACKLQSVPIKYAMQIKLQVSHFRHWKRAKKKKWNVVTQPFMVKEKKSKHGVPGLYSLK